MKFSDLAWGATLHYYKSSGDGEYVRLFRDTTFISKLRQTPWDISHEEFDAKVIHGFVNSIGLQLPAGTENDSILAEIIKLHPYTTSIEGKRLLDCNLSDEDLLENIKQIYNGLDTIPRLWLTGISKIAHVLNDSLFVVLDLRTAKHFGLNGEAEDYIKWLRIAQQNAIEVTKDFSGLGFPNSPEVFLAEKLGHSNYGCQKSLARFIDEYFWLTTSEYLPIPPKWVPPLP